MIFDENVTLFWIDEDVDITINYQPTANSRVVTYNLYKYLYETKDYSTTPFFVGNVFIPEKSREITLNLNEIVRSQVETYDLYKERGDAISIDVCNLYKLSITIDGIEYSQNFQVNLINRYPNDNITHKEFGGMTSNLFSSYNLLMGYVNGEYYYDGYLAVPPHIPYVHSNKLDFGFMYYYDYVALDSLLDSVVLEGYQHTLKGKGCVLEKQLATPNRYDMGSFYWNMSTYDLFAEAKFEHPDDEIWYTTSDNTQLIITENNQYLSNIIKDNTYKDGMGIIKLKNTLSLLPTNCFAGLNKLKSISLPQTVKVLGNMCFKDCAELQSIYMPSVLGISDNCFSGCKKYTEIILPETIMNIGSYAFEGENISFIKCFANNAPRITSTTFSNIPPTTPIYVPNIDKYKSNINWRNFKDWHALQNSETYVDDDNTGLAISDTPSIWINCDFKEILTYIDKCPAKYYLQWVDRYGGIQTQPFNGKSTLKEKFENTNIQNSKGYSRKVFIQDEFDWTLNSKWLTEYEYKVYEGIFVSPLVRLYDVENDNLYEVLVSDTSYTEKTYKNQKKLFNMTVNVTNNKKQRFLN